MSGWTHTMWIGAAIMGMVFVYVLVRGPRTPATEVDSGTTDDGVLIATSD